jgi:spore coat protein CotF
MTTVYSRLGYSFDTARFGNAAKLSSGAANTMATIANNTPSVPNWLKTDLAAGGIVKTNYLYNPTASNLASMLSSTITIVNAAISGNNTSSSNNYALLANAGNNLIISINSFKSHTDNISGITTVSNPNVPSYSTASSIGLQNFLTLSKTDGANTLTDTTPILGSFTSLFIPDILQANTIQLTYYATEIAANATPNLSNSEIVNITNYCTNTASILNVRRTADWAFYQNSVHVSQDYGFLMQFNNMGGTSNYLINNVIGTPAFVAKLNS